MALITITGHLKDNQGNIVQGSVVFQLVNYGGDNPRVSGTNIIVSIQTTVSADTAGFFTASIQGNDTIIPSGTYYQVTYRNALGKPATIVSYSFTGAGPINLDTQAVLNPPPSPPSPATLDQTYIRIDGSNIGGPTSGQYARGTGTVFASSVILAVDLPVFGASGASHSKGAVPDPGSIAGTTKFLREDATWQTVSAGGVTSVFTRTGAVVAVSGDYTAAQVTNAQDNSVSQAQNTVHAAPSGSAGVPTFRLLVASDIPNLDASKITTGILALARGGNTFSLLGDLIYGGVAAAPTVLPGNTTATQTFLRQTGTGAVSAAPVWATLVAGDIPSLDVSKITTGQLALARGGTHADLSATGGTNRVLKQSSVGADITVAVLVAADIPVFVASGVSHAPGGVPDPGAGAGTTKFLREDATFAVPSGGTGTVTSVALSAPSSLFTVTGSPVTVSGTLTESFATGQAQGKAPYTPGPPVLPFTQPDLALSLKYGPVVQTIRATPTAGLTQTFVFPNNVQAGDLILVAVVWSSTTVTASVTDSLGNTYVSAVGPTTNSTAVQTAQIFYARNILGGANTVTVTFSSSTTSQGIAVEAFGLDTSSAVLDQTNSATGNSTTPASGAVTTSTEGQLIFGFCYGGTTIVAGTNPNYNPLYSGSANTLAEWLWTTSAGSYNATFTAGNNQWIAQVATFKNAAISMRPAAGDTGILPWPSINPYRRIEHTVTATSGSVSAFTDWGCLSANVGGNQGTPAGGHVLGTTFNGTNANPFGFFHGVAGPSVINTIDITRSIYFFCRAGLGVLTTVRCWVCLTDQTPATMTGSDNPNGNYIGFRFSSVAGDTSWQAVAKDNSTQTVIPTGISVDTTAQSQNLCFVKNAMTGSITWYINGIQVASTTASIQTASTLIGWQAVFTRTSGAAVNLTLFVENCIIMHEF